MDLYKIEWKQSARKEIEKLGKKAILRIIQHVEKLAENPLPIGSRKLHGADHTYRLRVGNYRVIYSLYSEILTIEIIKVGHRKEVYRKGVWKSEY